MKISFMFLFIVSGILFSLPNINVAQSIKVWIEKNTEMEFVMINPGKFMMGTPPGEEGQFKGSYYHEVEITKPFYIGKYEVTQEQWEIITGNNPSHFKDLGKEYPVENINWFEIKEFIKKLNELTGEKFRLPTEAEWEFVCRAGTITPFSTGENITTEEANYCGEFPYKNFPKGICPESTKPVGSFKPNPWGVYDMHGNVWEWCEDWFCDYPDKFVKDPIGNCETDLKVIRGGSWYFNAESARSARRYTHNPNDRGFSLGFRLVREIPDKEN